MRAAAREDFNSVSLRLTAASPARPYGGAVGIDPHLARVASALWLLRTCHIVGRSMSRVSRKHTNVGVGGAEVMIRLGALPGNSLAMMELAAECGLTKSGATRIVARLERQGLVAREQEWRDRRQHKVRLTESGTQHLLAMLPEMALAVPSTWDVSTPTDHLASCG